jgi:hypothetical protein
MLKSLLFILTVSILTACSDGTQDVNLQEKLKKDTTVNSQQIIFAQPQAIDSSHIIIYPLIFQRETYGSSYGSSSGGQRASYWNLIFYDTETQQNNLLTTDKKILIYTFNFGSSSSSSSYSSDNSWSNGINIYKDHIIYTVVTNDYNANKQLDENDPTYLFVSNRDGTNFRQLSPDNYNISSWEVVKGTTKIIMQGQKDDNSDKSFNDKDAIVPLIVDVNDKTPAKETFTQNYIDSLKQRLLNIWRR